MAQGESISKGDEIVKVTINLHTFEGLIRENLLSESEYIIQTIEPHQEEYPNDPEWQKLDRDARSAYRALKDYCYEKRLQSKSDPDGIADQI
jgi:hypothetical protein